MIKKFRKEIAKGIHSFTYKDKLYKVIDDITIYHEDSDTVYYKDLDFWLYKALQDFLQGLIIIKNKKGERYET